MVIPCIKCSKLIDSRSKSGKCLICFTADGGRKISEAHRQKLREAKLRNPVRYWLGKRREDMIGHQWNLGRTTWNKGIPWSAEMIEKLSNAQKGVRNSPSTEFKKGLIPRNKGVFCNSNKGVHNWIKATAGHPEKCKLCGSTKNLEWSNKTHTYKKELSDWQFLCRKCHMSYDKKVLGVRKNEIYAKKNKVI